MREVKFYIIVSIFIVLSMAGVINAQWFERMSPTAGNISLTGDYGGIGTGVRGYSIDIPDSPYVLYSAGMEDSYAGEKLIIFDTSTSRFRDTFTRENIIAKPIIVPDMSGGWNIFIREDNLFKQIHIEANGEFGEEISLSKTYNGETIEGVGVPNTGDVIFVADKIYRYNSLSREWSTYHFPPGWDPDFKSLYLYLTESQNKLFITAKGNTIADYQGMIFDISDETGNILLSPEPIFFAGIVNITEWIDHDGFFLIQKSAFMQKSASLWIYNIKTNIIEHFMDTGDASTSSSVGFDYILQNASGKYIYYIGTKSIYFEFGCDIYIVDLENKTLESHTMQFEDGWSFLNNFKIIDRKRNRIITSLQNERYNEQKPVIINLEDLSWSYILSDYMDTFAQLLYKPEENKIIASGGVTNPYTQTIDIETGGNKKSVSVSYTPDNWSFKKDGLGPDLLGNYAGPFFCRMKPHGIREIHDLGMLRESKIVRIAQFPDSENAIMCLYHNQAPFYSYKEYSFKNNNLMDIDLPLGLLYNIYPDPIKNQLIYLSGPNVQFMRPHGKVRIFKLPEIFNITKAKFSLYDQDNNFIWICGINSTNELVFFKVSTDKYNVISYYKSYDSAMNAIVNCAIDPLERYFYLIERTNYDVEYHRKELLIYDIQSARLLKRQLLQDRAFDVNEQKRIIPSIVPIPQREKLFLWDGYSGWCFDTSTQFMEYKYGRMIRNPLAQEEGDTLSSGVWDDKRGLAIIVDMSFINSDIHRNFKRVLELDIDMGSVVKSIPIPKEVYFHYINQDKDKIFFLVPLKSQVLTLHLTPAWNDPATIQPRTNYIQYGIGDKARFSLKIVNPYDYEQKVLAYIWLVTPKGDLLYVSYNGIFNEPVGVPITLPANLDMTWDLFNFEVPQIFPEGFYNFNAMLVNENGDNGPMGTWNFYVKN
jgi:hypothetical protein